MIKVLKQILPNVIKDHFRLMLQRLTSIKQRAFSLPRMIFHYQTYNHIKSACNVEKAQINSIGNWIAYKPSRRRGIYKEVTGLSKNTAKPKMFGRPKIWPSYFILFAQKKISLIKVKNIFVTSEGRAFDFYGKTLGDLWHSPPLFFHKHLLRLCHGVSMDHKLSEPYVVSEVIIIQQQTHKTYGHFLIEVLPRLIIARDFCPESLPIYLGLDHGVYKEAIELLNISSSRLIDPYAYPVLKASVAHIPKYTKRRGWKVCRPLIDKVVNEIIYIVVGENENIKDVDHPKKIFLSRKKVCNDIRNDPRQMSNSDDIERLLSMHGFVIVHPEGLTFKEQVLLFNNAKYVVGEHGSAMFNTIFCKPGSVVIDLFPACAISTLFDVLEGTGIKYSPLTNPYGSMVKWDKKPFKCSEKYLLEALAFYGIK